MVHWFQKSFGFGCTLETEFGLHFWFFYLPPNSSYLGKSRPKTAVMQYRYQVPALKKIWSMNGWKKDPIYSTQYLSTFVNSCAAQIPGAVYNRSWGTSIVLRYGWLHEGSNLQYSVQVTLDTLHWILCTLYSEQANTATAGLSDEAAELRYPGRFRYGQDDCGWEGACQTLPGLFSTFLRIVFRCLNPFAFRTHIPLETSVFLIFYEKL